MQQVYVETTPAQYVCQDSTPSNPPPVVQQLRRLFFDLEQLGFDTPGRLLETFGPGIVDWALTRLMDRMVDNPRQVKSPGGMLLMLCSERKHDLQRRYDWGVSA